MISAMNLKQMFLGTINSGKQTVYTVPTTADSAVVKELVIYNASSETTNVVIYINDVRLAAQDVDAGDSLFGDKTWYLVLNHGDRLQVQGSTSLNVLVSGVETVSA